MRIVDIQRRLHEVGRIRIGHQVDVPGRNVRRPARLDAFRFTSASQRALEAVAALYGGEVVPWTGAPTGEQFELYTQAKEVPVIVPPGELSFSQSYELWSAGGCQRRCDGVNEFIGDTPCRCDAEARECKPHTRLSVMLQGVPGVGLWRLDTQGWYAAAELQGAYDLAQLLADSLQRSVLPGRLRVEARTVKRPDPKDPNKVEKRNYVVPVLDFDVDVTALALAGATTPAITPSAVTPIPSVAAPSLEVQLREVEQEPKRRANSPPAIRPTGVRPRKAAERDDNVPPVQAAAEAPAQAEAAATPESSSLVEEVVDMLREMPRPMARKFLEAAGWDKVQPVHELLTAKGDEYVRGMRLAMQATHA